MYTFTILRSSPKSLTSFIDILDPKRSKFGPKTAQMDGARFFLISNINFLKEDYKNSFYNKIQQNLMSHLEDVSSNVDFGPKRGKLGPKWAQNGWGKIFPGL